MKLIALIISLFKGQEEESMDLGIEAADVVIDLGFSGDNTLHLRFRRIPDEDVAQDILSVTSTYGWRVQRICRYEKPHVYEMFGDFIITCTGAKSDVVGMALGRKLIQRHALKIEYRQYITQKNGGTAYIEVPKLLLNR